MHACNLITDRLKNTLGCLCLAASLLLFSPGVHVVRAEDGNSPASPEAADARIQSEAQKPAIVPARPGEEAEMAPRIVDRGPAGRNDVINLNTRGYNYGPDRPTVAPGMARASLEAAKAKAPSAPAPAAPAAPTPAP